MIGVAGGIAKYHACRQVLWPYAVHLFDLICWSDGFNGKEVHGNGKHTQILQFLGISRLTPESQDCMACPRSPSPFRRSDLIEDPLAPVEERLIEQSLESLGPFQELFLLALPFAGAICQTGSVPFRAPLSRNPKWNRLKQLDASFFKIHPRNGSHRK